VQCENENLDLRIRFEDLAGCFEAIEVWHPDVENHDVGLKGQDFHHSLPAITSLSAHLPLGLITQESAQTAPHDFVVVCH
jgi:hypothetical protein